MENEPIRDIIRHGLRFLERELADAEQTTHGRLGPNTIADVGKTLAQAYESPSAHTASDLAQTIRGFLKEEKERIAAELLRP